MIGRAQDMRGDRKICERIGSSRLYTALTMPLIPALISSYAARKLLMKACIDVDTT